VLHVAGVVLRGVAQGFVPWANMFEFSLTSSAIVVGVFVVIQRWQDLKFLGVYITGFALVTLGVGTVNFYVPVKPLPDALDSYWLIIHVFVASLGNRVLRHRRRTLRRPTAAGQARGGQEGLPAC
jgi:ABC-type transport system involved in cytochrome c biogenesis permease subunit